MSHDGNVFSNNCRKTDRMSRNQNMIYFYANVKNSYIKIYTLRTKQYIDSIWPNLTIPGVYVSTLVVLVLNLAYDELHMVLSLLPLQRPHGMLKGKL